MTTRLHRLPYTLLLSLLAYGSAARADDLFSSSLARHGWWAALPAAFAIGVGTAFTPCVYPMISITVSVFGARKERGGRAVLLSTAFVFGIVAFFVPLGLIAALTGTLVGGAAGHPIVQVIEAALMFAMGLSMFGLFDVSLPASLQTRLATVGGLGVRGAFAIGFVTGPIAAPCAGPGLAGILDHVFRARDLVGGALALTAYSLGMGLLFWLVGVFAVSLPKPGVWMDRIKSVFGLVLFTVGLYYLRHLVGFFDRPAGLPYSRLFDAAWVIAGLALGAVHLSLKDSSSLDRARKVIGVALVSLGAAWFIAWEAPIPGIAWRSDARDVSAQARAAHRPVIVDFGASWCAKCNELTQRTFSDEAVRREVARFIPVRVDASEITDAVQATQQSYGVRALPVVLIYDSDGRERQRLMDFVPADRMAAILREVH